METVVTFLNGAKTFYLATIDVDGNQPRVRPMGFVMSYKGRLYMATSSTKDMYRQMRLNPKIEISATGADGQVDEGCRQSRLR
jgi:uncharacterized pyridoxamine 5'-phosphate oxidase family protein